MILDFSLSIADWKAMFEELINIFINFFDAIGIKLFADEETAKAAGYRPCGVCMKEEYKKWKENQ